MNPHSKFFTFVYEAPGDNPGGGEVTPPAEGGGQEQAPQWTPSQEEFSSLQEQVKQLTGIAPTVQQMSQYLTELRRQEENPEDEGELDLGAYIEQVVQRSIAPMIPVVQTAAQKSGQEKLKELFGEHEKSLGKFDHELAERAAQSYFNETGDPVKSVEAGAKYAAEYEKRVRDAAVEEYKKSLKRGPHELDPDVSNSGERTAKPAKTYDEVVERWAGQTEV